MFKLCPSFLEGANFYVQIIIFTLYRKSKLKQDGSSSTIEPFHCSPPDSVITDHCSLTLPLTNRTYGTRYFTQSGTGTRSEDATTSLPQTHYTQNVLIPA